MVWKTENKNKKQKLNNGNLSFSQKKKKKNLWKVGRTKSPERNLWVIGWSLELLEQFREVGLGLAVWIPSENYILDKNMGIE